MISQCPGCGVKWSDGRAYCDHDHCGRADLPGTLRTLRRKHYQPTRAAPKPLPAVAPQPLPEQPKAPRITVHRITR